MLLTVNFICSRDTNQQSFSSIDMEVTNDGYTSKVRKYGKSKKQNKWFEGQTFY
jgi:hypothetical protein